MLQNNLPKAGVQSPIVLKIVVPDSADPRTLNTKPYLTEFNQGIIIIAFRT
jgi:hypothetical protein